MMMMMMMRRRRRRRRRRSEERYQERSGEKRGETSGSKAADKWRRAHLERGEGCDRHKKRTQTGLRFFFEFRARLIWMDSFNLVIPSMEGQNYDPPRPCHYYGL